MWKKLFSDKDFNKKLLQLAFPIALQNMMLSLVAVADAFMLGRLHQDAMSAVSLATQVQFLQNMVMGGFITATSVLGAQYWGKNDKRTVSDVFCIGLRINVVVSVLTFLGCELIPEMLMMIFTNEPALISIGAQYLRIAGWSYLMTGVSQSYLCIFKVSDQQNHAAIISSTTVVINILFNAVFIFGFLGVPRMEASGAAVATLISRVVELVWCIVLSARPAFVRPTIKGLIMPPKVLRKDMWVCAWPLAAGFLLWSVGFSSYSAFMGHLGKDAAAANAVSAVVRELVCCVCNGLASGGGILLGFALGKGDLENGKVIGTKLCILSYLCGGLSTLVMLAVTPLLLHSVKLTDQASEYLLGMMLIMSFYMIGRCVNTVTINGVFDSGGDTKFDAYSLAVVMWCIAVPLAALGTFVFHWHPLVVYAMTCLDEVGKIPWVMIRFKKYKWLNDLTRSEEELRADAKTVEIIG